MNSFILINGRDAARHVSTTQPITRVFIPLLLFVFATSTARAHEENLPEGNGIFLFPTCENKSDLASKLYAELVLSATPNTLAKKKKRSGWQLLFDGKTANGWRGYNMQKVPDVWTIEEGCLIMNSEGGNERQDIMTNDVYRDVAGGKGKSCHNNAQWRRNHPLREIFGRME